MLKRLATFLFGVALIGLGVFIFMAPEQAYLVQLLKKSWPLFLVLAGLVRLAGYLIDRHPQSPVGSLLLTALGGILLAINLRGETSLTGMIGRYWFWFLLAFLLGRVLRQYTSTNTLGKPVRALSPGAIFVTLLIAGTGLGANYLSKNDQLLTHVHQRLGQLGGVGEYVFGNPIRIEDEPSLTFKLPPNARLSFASFDGDIEIRGTATTQATAKLTKFLRVNNEERARELAKQIHLQINSAGNTLQFSLVADGLKGTYTAALLIELPHQQVANVEINEVMGAIKLSDLRGEHQLRNCGHIKSNQLTGHLTIENARGPVEIEQHLGDLTLNNLRHGADLSEIKGRLELQGQGGSYRIRQHTGPVHASITSGKLELREILAPTGFPANERLVTLDELRDTRTNLSNISGSLMVNAIRSRIDADGINGDIQITTHGEPLKLSRCTGALRVEAENSSVTASDLRGAAQIEATRDIAVQNFAGPLTIKSRTGKITLSTSAELEGDVTTFNEHGQTRLNLPRDIVFRLDVNTISGRLRARGFEWLELERNQKTITATPPANGKLPLVSLRSSSGDIELQASGLALASN
jgi:DUF4097 and DUF4098 domain-containing protein YvlB